MSLSLYYFAEAFRKIVKAEKLKNKEQIVQRSTTNENTNANGSDTSETDDKVSTGSVFDEGKKQQHLVATIVEEKFRKKAEVEQKQAEKVQVETEKSIEDKEKDRTMINNGSIRDFDKEFQSINSNLEKKKNKTKVQKNISLSPNSLFASKSQSITEKIMIEPSSKVYDDTNSELRFDEEEQKFLAGQIIGQQQREKIAERIETKINVKKGILSPQKWLGEWTKWLKTKFRLLMKSNKVEFDQEQERDKIHQESKNLKNSACNNEIKNDSKKIDKFFGLNGKSNVENNVVYTDGKKNEKLTKNLLETLKKQVVCDSNAIKADETLTSSEKQEKLQQNQARLEQLNNSLANYNSINSNSNSNSLSSLFIGGTFLAVIGLISFLVIKKHRKNK